MHLSICRSDLMIFLPWLYLSRSSFVIYCWFYFEALSIYPSGLELLVGVIFQTFLLVSTLTPSLP